MTSDVEAAILAEIEGIRADIRRREAERERSRREADLLDLPTIDVSTLELPQIRALIKQRFVDGRVERRLLALEQRVAELEAAHG